MFNLEPAILKWRQQMLAAGVKTPVPLEELENHLRDGIDQNVKAGMSELQAFEAAVRQMGNGRVVSAEFKKTTRGYQLFRASMVAAALFAPMFGGAMVLPALARLKHAGILPWEPFLIGLSFILIGGGVAIYSLKRQRLARGRGLVSGVIVFAGIFYLVPLIQSFFMCNVGLYGWIVCGGLAVASVLFYGTCLRWHLSASPRRTG